MIQTLLLVTTEKLLSSLAAISPCQVLLYACGAMLTVLGSLAIHSAVVARCAFRSNKETAGRAGSRREGEGAHGESQWNRWVPLERKAAKHRR